jgi:hypothetical protein
MKLYHGSMVQIPEPHIIIPDDGHTSDFGTGFYTTTDYNQAKKWINVRRNRGETGPGYVNIYDVDDNLLNKEKYNVLKYTGASKEWLEFVLKNRNEKGFTHNFDMVYGPVANDRVYAVLSLFESKFIDIDNAIKQLKTYTLVDQILFHTEAVLTELNFSGSDKI